MALFQRIKKKGLSVLLYEWRFKRFGKKSRIESPLLIEGAGNIEVGERVCIKPKTWLACLPLTGEKNPIISIGNGSVIGHFNHIYATKSIVIEDYVLTADKVYISDNLHSYEDINTPIIGQAIKQLSPIIIGEGSWLGENVAVIGASIGKHCVIGANAVVTKDIPDYSVAVGIPAKVIKRYNLETKKWEKI